MSYRILLTSLVLTLAFSQACLNAAENPSTAASGKKHKKAVKSEASAQPTFLERKQEGGLKRAHHLAEKSANRDFLSRPEGIGFKKQLAAVDDAINAVYEKNLNIFQESPEKGKRLHEEMDRQVQLLEQKRKKIETDYENLTKTSPVYRAMVEKHLKSELGQFNRKHKTKPSDKSVESEESEEIEDSP